MAAFYSGSKEGDKFIYLLFQLKLLTNGVATMPYGKVKMNIIFNIMVEGIDRKIFKGIGFVAALRVGVRLESAEGISTSSLACRMRISLPACLRLLDADDHQRVYGGDGVGKLGKMFLISW